MFNGIDNEVDMNSDKQLYSNNQESQINAIINKNDITCHENLIKILKKENPKMLEIFEIKEKIGTGSESVVYKEAEEGEDSGDLDPEFKEMMDSYEAFFDEYIAFMEKYKENPTDMSLLSELSDMLTKEAEMLKEMEGLDQSEMSAAELAYYLEVTGRIYEKLAKVTQF